VTPTGLPGVRVELFERSTGRLGARETRGPTVRGIRYEWYNVFAGCSLAFNDLVKGFMEVLSKQGIMSNREGHDRGA
jgi:hypothetical protein